MDAAVQLPALGIPHSRDKEILIRAAAQSPHLAGCTARKDGGKPTRQHSFQPRGKRTAGTKKSLFSQLCNIPKPVGCTASQEEKQVDAAVQLPAKGETHSQDKEIFVFTAVQYPRTGRMHSQPGRKAS